MPKPKQTPKKAIRKLDFYQLQENQKINVQSHSSATKTDRELSAHLTNLKEKLKNVTDEDIEEFIKENQMISHKRLSELLLPTKSINQDNSNNAILIILLLRETLDFYLYLTSNQQDKILKNLIVLQDIPLIFRLMDNLTFIDSKRLKKSNSSDVYSENTIVLKDLTKNLIWHTEYETKDSFKTVNSFNNYKKIRENISKALQNNNCSFSSIYVILKNALISAMENGLVIKLSWFLVRVLDEILFDQEEIKSDKFLVLLGGLKFIIYLKIVFIFCFYKYL